MLHAADAHRQGGVRRLGPNPPQRYLVGADIKGQAGDGRMDGRPAGNGLGNDIVGPVVVPQVFGVHIDGGTGGRMRRAAAVGSGNH